jgi:hypothetical protein
MWVIESLTGGIRIGSGRPVNACTIVRAISFSGYWQGP